ncbi:MAG TPA: phosphoribosylformylglycinamidine synthase subunit PurL [Gemmatimonadota bacterium]|nr:phosphoribosylformylglycinamidine synthase subunit PurL [Gemmatimonadota bacterium]
MTTAIHEPPVTTEAVQAHGLTAGEYARICELLGREPNFTELGVFSLMWSEHCGYKYSRAWLAELPTSGPHVLQGPGENAGAVDIGDGLAVVFKMESHNHPSAIEPYQGAATGVGGILRDVFTMGARPVALLDSLRFGEPDDPHVRYLFRHVVRGIGDYGNCVGVPTVGGEIVFDDAYRGNPLVNAMCVGVLRHDRLMRAAAGEPGNGVYVLGAATGRDGIHGASRLASTELSQDSTESRPTVQIGDPFSEKLLLEATLELIESGVTAGIQDMGAAGLTSSSSEMASRAGTGIEIDVDRVPRREPGMTAYEVLLSESQERMLVVAGEAREPELMAIAAKWDLPCTRVGTVTADGVWRVLEGGAEVCAIPVAALTEEVPRYVREVERPEYVDALHAWSPPGGWLDGLDPLAALETLLGSPSIASKRWVWEQYDHQVRTSTVTGPGADAAVLSLRGSNRGLALTVDGNGRYAYCDPRRGAALAVAEAARNLAAVGARPLAVTDCLNFGNPEKDAVYWQFTEAIRGLADACRALGTPVVSGNVSFYNESRNGAIHPTPTVGMVGVIDDLERRIPPDRAAPGDRLLLIGGEGTHLGASSFLKEVGGECAGRAPAVDLEAERAHGDAVRTLNEAGLIRTARDVSDGGLAVAAAELLFALDPEAGIELEIPPDEVWGAFFGEDGARFVVAVAAPDERAARDLLAARGVPARPLGRIAADGVYRLLKVGERSRAALAEHYFGAIPRLMDRVESSR